MRSSSSAARGCQTGLPSGPACLGAVHHDRETDPVDLRLILDQRPNRLADLVIGGFLLACFLRAGALLTSIGVRQVVLHRHCLRRFSALRCGVHRLRAARHLSIRVEMLLRFVDLVEAHAHGGLGAYMAGAQAALQHLFDRTRQSQLCAAAHFLGRHRGRGLHRPVRLHARASAPRESTMAMFCGRSPGTAAATRLRIACTPSWSSWAAPAIVSITLACASCLSRANGSRCGSTR